MLSIISRKDFMRSGDLDIALPKKIFRYEIQDPRFNCNTGYFGWNQSIILFTYTKDLLSRYLTVVEESKKVKNSRRKEEDQILGYGALSSAEALKYCDNKSEKSLCQISHSIWRQTGEG